MCVRKLHKDPISPVLGIYRETGLLKHQPQDGFRDWGVVRDVVRLLGICRTNFWFLFGLCHYAVLTLKLA